MRTVQDYYYSHAKYYSGHIKWPNLSDDTKNFWNIYYHKYLAQKQREQRWLDDLASECTTPNQ